MNGRDGTTTFLPLDSKIGGQVSHERPNIGQFLTREQDNYIYKKVEAGEIINTNTIQQEIEQEDQLNRIDDTNGEINPYQELIINNAERIDPLKTQIEQWSILSNVLHYVQHDRHYTLNHTLDVRTVNKHNNKLDTTKEEESVELDFGSTPLKLSKEYLDVYDGVQPELVDTTRFNENSDLSMTYLGRSNKARNDKLKVEESFPISEHGYTSGKLLDGTEFQLLLDTGVSKSFMLKIILHVMQVTPFLTQICIKNSKDTSRKWPMCKHFVYHTNNHSCAQP